MSDLTGGRPRRTITRRTIRQRALAGLSVAGVCATVILTGAATGNASAGSAPPAVRGGNTITQTTSTADGKMKIQVRYRYEPRQRIKLISVTYSGGSRIAVRHPALVFILRPLRPLHPPGRPSPPRAPAQVRKGFARVPSPPILIIAVSLKAGHLRNFTGSLPARLINATRRGGGLSGQELLTVSLTSLVRTKLHGPTQIVIQPAMQVGMVLTPAPR